MRIALFAPIPPTRSGIAAYTAALLPWLARQHVVDLFTAERPRRDDAPPAGAARVFSAHDFLWRRAREQYDLVIYQLGNSIALNYMWPYLVRYPGLVVIHDGNLHAARAFHFLSRGDIDGYRAEFAFNDPANAAAAELGVAGAFDNLRAFWPMLRVPVAAARTVAVHNPWLAERLQAAYPGARIERIRPGMDDPRSNETTAQRAAIRTRHGLLPETVVFGAFGWVTPEKRIPQILRAMAGTDGEEPNTHLLLVGETVDHYDVRAELREAGVEHRVTVAGYVDDGDLPCYLAATDVCLCLRWPTTRETSATWLRALAAGKATIVTDLAHNADVPVLAAERLNGAACVASRADPVAVAVDIHDEERTLLIAMRALARDPDLRWRLGVAARAWWADSFRMEHAAEDYERVMTATVTRTAARPAVPPHLDNDGGRRARDILSPFGLLPDFLRRE